MPDASHRRAGLEGAVADEVMEIEFQGGLDRGFPTVVAASLAAHVVSRLYEILCRSLISDEFQLG